MFFFPPNQGLHRHPPEPDQPDDQGAPRVLHPPQPLPHPGRLLPQPQPHEPPHRRQLVGQLRHLLRRGELVQGGAVEVLLVCPDFFFNIMYYYSRILPTRYIAL